jgi:hypothetical protein
MAWLCAIPSVRARQNLCTKITKCAIQSSEDKGREFEREGSEFEREGREFEREGSSVCHSEREAACQVESPTRTKGASTKGVKGALNSPMCIETRGDDSLSPSFDSQLA